MVERVAVNHDVVGSNPTLPVEIIKLIGERQSWRCVVPFRLRGTDALQSHYLGCPPQAIDCLLACQVFPYSLIGKTSDFGSEITGSIPVGGVQFGEPSKMRYHTVRPFGVTQVQTCIRRKHG